MDKKYSPTEAELKVINEKFAKEPHSIDDLYVFPAMIVNNEMTAYYTRIHPDFLKQCTKDLATGVVFLVGHDKTKLPMAKSFKGKSVTEGDVVEVFSKFFMQKNLNVNGVNTDDFMKAYLGGTLEDVSIGFAANRWECSICKNDIRDYQKCVHWPGTRYNEKNEKVEKGGTQCFAWVKEPAGPTGEALLEVSACYKGAVPNAKLKDPKDVPTFSIELTEGKKLKEMALDTPIAVNFSCPILKPAAQDAIDVILSKEVSETETKVLKDLAVKNKVDLGELLKTFPAFELLHSEKEYPRLTRDEVKALPDDSFAAKGKNGRYFPHHNEKGILGPLHLKAALARVSQVKDDDIRGKASAHLEQHKLDLEKEATDNEIKELKAKLDAANTNNKVVMDKVTKLELEKKNLTDKVELVEAANVQLQTDKKALEPKAKEGVLYREDLIKEILDLGVRLNGNAFDSEAHKKTLENMAIEDIKKMKAASWAQLCDKLPEVRNSLGPEAKLSDSKQEEIPDSAFKVD